MNAPVSPPDGEVLSCYTASVAELLYRQGEDWAAIIGLSSVFAVRPAGELFAFLHHGSSLRDAVHPSLVRAGSDDLAEALERISAALQACGPVIVVGDAFNLPWSTRCDRAAAPHWFTVDARHAGHWQITDRFSMLDEHGRQDPWQGAIPTSEMGRLLSTSPLRPEQLLRERHALGDDEPLLPLRYQWFDPAGGPGAGQRQASGGWLFGGAAVRAVIEHFAAAAEPQAYSQADDLWVAGRHRRLRHRALTARLTADDPAVLAAERLAAAWARLPMVLHYAEEAARRGRVKSSAVVSVLETIADAEDAAESATVATANSAGVSIFPQDGTGTATTLPGPIYRKGERCP